MKHLKHRIIVIGAVLVGWLTAGGSLSAVAQDAKVLYENNFEKIEVTKKPEDFMILDGGFAVKEEGGNKFLELPGAPLDTYGTLFGPTAKSDVAVTARIFSTKKGRRFPTFAVGLNGQGGYRLQISPGKSELELYKGDDIVAHVPFEWKSGEWTILRLQSVIVAGGWKIEGKAWTKGSAEPDKPLVNFDEKTEPTPGRASIWGSPYATTPIQYDDLVVSAAVNKP